jgi:hypothetical protein
MTTAHPAEDTLRAFLDDELLPAEREDLDSHVGECTRCHRTLDALRREEAEARALLESLDVPAPVDMAWRRVRRRNVTGAGGGRNLLRAALVLLIAAGAVSATVPGSPVRGWLEDVVRGENPVPPQIAVNREAAAAPEPEGGAVSIVPEDAARVVLTDVPSGTPLVLRLHDGERLRLHAAGGPAGPFRTATNRIHASLGDATRLRLEVPRGGPAVTVEVNGAVVARKEAGELRLTATGIDTVRSVGDEVTVKVPR